jgi:hypothetical protein
MCLNIKIHQRNVTSNGGFLFSVCCWLNANQLVTSEIDSRQFGGRNFEVPKLADCGLFFQPIFCNRLSSAVAFWVGFTLFYHVFILDDSNKMEVARPVVYLKTAT